jgi:hypothetical protein
MSAEASADEKKADLDEQKLPFFCSNPFRSASVLRDVRD